MKKAFILILSLSVLLLTACGQQGDANTSSTITSTSQITSYPESGQAISSTKPSKASSAQNYSSNSSEPIDWVKLNIPTEDIVEMGMTGFITSDDSEPIIIQDKNQIQSILNMLNRLRFGQLSEKPTYKIIYGDSRWSIWWVDKNGEKTVLEHPYNNYIFYNNTWFEMPQITLYDYLVIAMDAE